MKKIISAIAVASLIATTAFADQIDIAPEIDDNEGEVYFVPTYPPDADGLQYAASSSEQSEVGENNTPAYDPTAGDIFEEYNQYLENGQKWESGRGTEENLNYYYNTRSEIPEYISFINAFSKSYNAQTKKESILYYIGIKGLDDEKKNAVLDVLSTECKAFFYDCPQSYAERMSAADEIRSMKGVKNVLANLSEERITVLTEEDAFEELSRSIKEKYGDKTDVYINDPNAILTADGADYIPEIGTGDNFMPDTGGDTSVPYTGIDITSPEKSSVFENPVFWVIAAGVIMMLGGALFFALRAKAAKSRLKVTAEGKTAADLNYSKKDVEKAVKNAEEAPSGELFDKILKKINK